MGQGQSQWDLTMGQGPSQWKLNKGPRTVTVEVKQWAKDSHSGS